MIHCIMQSAPAAQTSSTHPGTEHTCSGVNDAGDREDDDENDDSDQGEEVRDGDPVSSLLSPLSFSSS